ncbi:uncharacterized protein VTP21DRAFT_3693 [Calcarisporiella thermophila]|uniref:uncharacterized protein n=1 Tax=Calcarisporiella thermophila TaxID=911321 RepID=UPI00374334F3
MHKRLNIKYLLLALFIIVALHFLFSSSPAPEVHPEPNFYHPSFPVDDLANTTRRARAAFVVLARNWDIYSIRYTMQQMEDRFNRKYGYPWVFLNDEDFSEDFKIFTRAITKSPTYYGTIPKEHWSIPSWIDEEKARKSREEMEKNHVVYGGSLSYRHMCRFESGFFFRHPLLQDYDYYWRVEPSVQFFCDLDFDPFLYMQDHGKKYGFTIAVHEFENTIPTLWQTVRRFINEHPHLIPTENAQKFITDDDGQTYNLCHFWSNFEIGDLRFWRSDAYLKFFEYLDKAGGFFYERWGDAPVHSIAASLFLKKEEIHFFNEIGYKHDPFMHCPTERDLNLKCSCNPSENFDMQSFSCLPKWYELPFITALAQMESQEANKVVLESAAGAAPVHSFDPDASPDKKAAQAEMHAPAGAGTTTGVLAHGGVGTELGSRDAEVVKRVLNASAEKCKHKSIKMESKKKEKKHVKKGQKIGWRCMMPTGDDVNSKDAGDKRALYKQNMLSHLTRELYFLDVLENSAYILVAVLASHFLVIYGGVAYYSVHVQRLRRNFRDELSRELSRQSLESESESADWLNAFLDRFWLIYEPVLSGIVVSIVDQILADSAPGFIDSLRLSTFTLGTTAPRIEAVKTYPHTNLNEVLMDWKVVFTSREDGSLDHGQHQKVPPKIVLNVRVGKGVVGAGMPILVEDISFRGNAKVKLSFTGAFPHIKTFSLSFDERPKIDFKLKPIGGETFGFDVANMPGLASFIDHQMHATLGPMMYSPNVFTLDIESILNPSHDTTRGVLQVTLRNCHRLKNMELFGKSDPYVKFMLGGQEVWRSETKKDTTNPFWNETQFFLMASLGGRMSLEVWDKNPGKDVRIGTSEVDLSGLEGLGLRALNLPVEKEGKQYGDLLIDLGYFPVFQPRELENGEIEPTPPSNTGIFRLTLHQAKGLSRAYNTYAVMRVNGTEVSRTKPRKHTMAPSWEHTHEMLILDRERALVSVTLMDEGIMEDEVIGQWTCGLDEFLDQVERENEEENVQEKGWLGIGEGVRGKIRVSSKWRPVFIVNGEKYLQPQAAKVENMPNSQAKEENAEEETPIASRDFAAAQAVKALPPTPPAKDAGAAASNAQASDLTPPATSPPAESTPTFQSSPPTKAPTATPTTNGTLHKTAAPSPPTLRGKKLIVTLAEAKDLIGADKNGSSDPYVKAYVGGKQVYKTKYLKKTLTPHWDETFDLQMQEDTSLALHVLDHNTLGSDDPLGKCEINIQELVSNSDQRADIWVPLRDGAEGKVRVKVEVR